MNIFVLVVVLALVVPQAASQDTLKVTITSKPPEIYAGDVYEITVQTEPGAICKFEIRFRTPWFSEERKANARGIVTRKFHSNRNTRQGNYVVVVSCELDGRKGWAETSLTVK